MQTKQSLRHLPEWLVFIIIIIYLLYLYATHLMVLGCSEVLNRNARKNTPESVQHSKTWSGLSANPEIVDSKVSYTNRIHARTGIQMLFPAIGIWVRGSFKSSCSQLSQSRVFLPCMPSRLIEHFCSALLSTYIIKPMWCLVLISLTFSFVSPEEAIP